MKQKLEYEIKKGYAVRVEIKDKEMYKNSFLEIFNRVIRDDEFIRIDNNYKNDFLSVVCTDDALKKCRECLSGFGELADCEIIYYLNCNIDDFYYKDNKKYALTINPY